MVWRTRCAGVDGDPLRLSRLPDEPCWARSSRQDCEEPGGSAALRCSTDEMQRPGNVAERPGFLPGRPQGHVLPGQTTPPGAAWRLGRAKLGHGATSDQGVAAGGAAGAAGAL